MLADRGVELLLLELGDEMLPRPCRSRRKSAAGMSPPLFLGLAYGLTRSLAKKKSEKRKSARWKNAKERRKKSNGELECPRIRDIQQRRVGKQRALGKEKAAATSLEKRKRKKTYLGVFEFRNGGAERDREREVARRKQWGAVFKIGKNGGVIRA